MQYSPATGAGAVGYTLGVQRWEGNDSKLEPDADDHHSQANRSDESGLAACASRAARAMVPVDA